MTHSTDPSFDPFVSPREATEERRRSRPPRWVGVALAILSSLVGLFFAWNALILWAIATIVDPSLDPAARSQEILDRFFYRDGPLLGVTLFAMVWLSAVGLVAATTYLFVVIARFPGLGLSALIALVVGTALAAVVFVLLIANG